MNDGIKIRNFRPDDHEQVLGLAPRLTEGVAPWRDALDVRKAVHEWIRGSIAEVDRPDRAVFVAEHDGTIVGVVTAGERRHFTGRVDAYVGELAVAPGMERQKIATRLMSAAEGWAARRGFAFITLETGAANVSARKLYESLGYLEEDVRLTKSLSTPHA